jgi:hypothetical protein
MLALTLAALSMLGSVTWSSGSLVVLADSNKVVSAWTDSNITHVGVLMHKDGESWIYEATPGSVRRVTLSAYCRELSEQNGQRRKPIRLWVMQPEKPYSDAQLERMQTYLDRQLGRRYSVKGYVRKRPVDGIHCAELASTALSHGERIDVPTPFAMSPGALYEKVSPVYRDPEPVTLPSRPAQSSWCSRAWDDWFGFQNWCQWACVESWQFCW